MKWDKNYTVVHQQPGGGHNPLQLPPATKKKLWANIKARHPEKAKLMMEALTATREFFPEAELTLKQSEYEEYMKC